MIAFAFSIFLSLLDIRVSFMFLHLSLHQITYFVHIFSFLVLAIVHLFQLHLIISNCFHFHSLSVGRICMKNDRNWVYQMELHNMNRCLVDWSFLSSV